MNVGCGNLRAASEGVLAEAKKRARVPAHAGPIELASDREVIAWLLAVRDAEQPASVAARLVYEAFKTDDDVLAQIDAAFRLGGAEAVRDLVLRGPTPKG